MPGTPRPRPKVTRRLDDNVTRKRRAKARANRLGETGARRKATLKQDERAHRAAFAAKMRQYKMREERGAYSVQSKRMVQMTNGEIYQTLTVRQESNGRTRLYHILRKDAAGRWVRDADEARRVAIRAFERESEARYIR